MLYGDILLVIHIMAAGAWLGGNILQATAPSMIGRDNATVVSGWYRLTEKMSSRFYMPIGITVLITGIFLVLNSNDSSFGSVFVNIGFVTVIVGGVLGARVFGPTSLAMADAVDSGNESAIATSNSKLTRFGVFDTLLLVFTFYVMVSKLGA